MHMGTVALILASLTMSGPWHSEHHTLPVVLVILKVRKHHSICECGAARRCYGLYGGIRYSLAVGVHTANERDRWEMWKFHATREANSPMTRGCVPGTRRVLAVHTPPPA